MFNYKRSIFFILYFIIFFTIIIINSNLIVEWLNKSLFLDFSMDINLKHVNESFFNGTSFVFLIFVLMYALFGTFIIGLILTNLLFSGLVLGNQLKVEQRNEFVTFNELQTIASPKELLSLIDMSISTFFTFVFVIILLLVALHLFIRHILNKFNFRVGVKTRIVIFLIAFIPLVFIFQKPNMYNEIVLKYENASANNWDPVSRAKKDGFLPSFFHTISPIYMDKPENYSKEKMRNINQKYTHLADDINKNRTSSLNNTQTIFYLSETLMDPMNVPNLIKNDTPIPFISEMVKNHAGGTMYSPYIGGGTANIEWSLLTSFSVELLNEPLATPYSDFYLSAKNHNTILNYFHKEKVALHPYTANFYKRRSVYDAIGFDDFLFLNNGIQNTEKLGTHVRISDAAFHKDLLRVASNEKVGVIHALTMQNHSPFTGEIPEMDYKPDINLDIYPEEKEKELVNYLQGIRASDEAIENLILDLDSLNKDINIVFFGDHLPNLFRGLEDKFPNGVLHETPWFIYMNNGRNENNNCLEQLSPIFLTTVLLREGNYYVTPFHGLMDELLNHGVKRIGEDYITNGQGRVLDEDIDASLLEMINDYRNIVYDALFGSDWLPDDFFSI